METKLAIGTVPPVLSFPPRLPQDLLFLQMALSPVVFSLATLEAFEFNKVSLLLLTAVLLVTGTAATLVGRGTNSRLRAGWDDVRRSPVALGVVGFSFSALLSTMISCSPRTSCFGAHESFAGLVTIAAYALLFFATRALFRTTVAAECLLSAPVIGATFAAGYAVLQVVRLDPIQWTSVSPLAGYVRPFASLGHPNQLGAYLAMVLPLAVYFTWRAAQGRHWGLVSVFLFIGALLGFAVLASVSRGAWLALAGASILAVLPWLRGRRLGAAAGIGLLATLGFVAWIGCGTASQGLLNGVLERGRHFGDASSRVYIWRAALAIWREHPLLGCGLDTFHLAFQGQRTPGYWQVEWNGTPTKAHCDALQVLATQGLFGAAAALAFTLALLRAGWRAWRAAAAEARPLVAALVAVCVAFYLQGLFSFTTASTGGLFVTVAALLSRLGETDVSACTTEISVASCPHPAPRSVLRGVGQLGIWSAGLTALVFLVVLPGLASRSARTGDELLARDPSAAVKALETAVALDPGRDLYWARLAAAYQNKAFQGPSPQLQQEDLLRARSALDRAVKREPLQGYHYANRGRLRADMVPLNLATADESYADFDRALQLDEANAYFYLHAGHAARNLGDLARAKTYVNRGLDRYPRFGPLRTQEAFLAMCEDRPTDAEAMSSEAPYLDWHDDMPAYLNLLSVMAWGRLQQHAYEDAFGVSRHVLQHFPDWGLPRFTAAQALEGLGRKGEALAEYRQLLLVCPAYGPACEASRRLERELAATAN